MNDETRADDPGPGQRGSPTGAGTTVPPVTERERDEWRAMLAERVAETRRRRELREQVRLQLAISRAAGLRRRQINRLRRSA